MFGGNDYFPNYFIYSLLKHGYFYVFLFIYNIFFSTFPYMSVNTGSQTRNFSIEV